MRAIVTRYWFLIGLIGVFVVTLLDPTTRVAALGRLLKQHHGPDIVIFLVFFFSGILLQPGQIRTGLADLRGTTAALILIFGIAPVSAALFGLLPLDPGIQIGLFLVAVMPTTLSSGVVMTGAAGGNMAHALFITVLANICCVVTIPMTLPLLLNLSQISQEVAFDQISVMLKIGLYVLVPLGLSMGIKYLAPSSLSGVRGGIQIINQLLILMIVWMGVSQATTVLFKNAVGILPIIVLTTFFHLIMLGIAFLMVTLLGFAKGRREAVVFMGSQKTLPLSVILQVTMFGQYGQALLVCVLHHLISLLIDGYLVGWFKSHEDTALHD